MPLATRTAADAAADTPVAEAAAAVAELCRTHPVWAGRLAGEEPVYALPEAAVDALARPAGGTAAPPLDREAALAERGFSRVCDRLRAVGFCRGAPVAYPYLGLPVPVPSDALLDWYGGAEAATEAVRDALRRTADAHERLAGVAGWLLTDPVFRRERDDLRAGCGRDPTGASHVPSDRLSEGRSHAFDGAASGVARFLDRWGLTALATWDLPVPRGPFVPALHPTGDPNELPAGVRVYIPVHYPLQGADDLLRRVRDEQRAVADELGLPAGLGGGISRYGAYAQILRLVHLEGTIIGRCGSRRPRGLVTRIVDAAADHLGVSESRVRQLRKAAAACLAGRRAKAEGLL